MRSTHAVRLKPPTLTVQALSPVPQDVPAATHVPALQTGAVDGQTLPHPPHARGSLATSTQAVNPPSEHEVVPGRQEQTPEPLQYWSLRQLAPHAPQLFGSSMRSRQTPLQFVLATGDVGHAQAPVVHSP